MKSIFEPSPFGSRGLPGYASPPLGAVRLGQAAPVTPDQSNTTAVAGGIEDLLKQLPPEVLGAYNAKYQACQAQLANGGAVGLVAGAKCLDDLYSEIKNFLKNGPPKAAPAPAAPASEFPVLPAVVGGLGLIVLIWGLTKL